MKNSETSGRFKSIDFLRGIAVVLVLFRHVPNLNKLSDIPILYPTLKILENGGWIGVDLFFVLSGFLVSGLIFKEIKTSKTFDAKRFLIRRGLKIYPAFYVFLFLTLILEFLVGNTFSWAGIVGELVYLQNYVGYVWGHTWSLAVEEHFYLLLAFLAVILLPRRKTTFVMIVLGLIIGIPIMRSFLAVQTAFSFQTHLYPSHLRFDALFFGVMLAWLKTFDVKRFQAVIRFTQNPLIIALTFVIIGLNFILPIEHIYIHSIGLSLNSIAFSVVLVQAWVHEYFRWPQWITKIGYYSYSIYLWHMALRYWPEQIVNKLLPTPIAVEWFTPVYYLGGGVSWNCHG